MAPMSCRTGGSPSLKNELIVVYAFPSLWLQMLYLIFKGETLQHKCGLKSGEGVHIYACAPMYSYVKSSLSAPAKNVKQSICAGN